MKISNNKIEGVTFKKSPNQSGDITPKFIIAHFTASSTAEGAISWMVDPASKVSAHLHLDKSGMFVQLVEFNKRAYHVGKSEYKGVSDLNWHSVGIEMQNRGRVNGVYEDYTDEQINSFVDVCKALIKAYPSIKEILAHSEVATPKGRKDDPGPKFPMERVRREVFGTNYVKTKNTISDLNIREGAGIQYRSLGVLQKGTEVNVLNEVEGWSEVFVCSNKIKGWVSSKYII